MIPLSSKRRSELRAQAHALRPLVLIGDKGLTDEVVAEIDRSLKAHELVKVRAAAAAREQRDIWLETLCERLQAHPVQQIGKIFVLYRENPEEPREKARPAPAPRTGVRAEVVSERGRKAQRARDAGKQRLRDIEDMKRKGKIPAFVKTDAEAKPAPRARGDDARAEGEATRTSRPRSRTPAPLPESGPRRRRPRTSR
jgi:RNA-binding protein